MILVFCLQRVNNLVHGVVLRRYSCIMKLWGHPTNLPSPSFGWLVLRAAGRIASGPFYRLGEIGGSVLPFLQPLSRHLRLLFIKPDADDLNRPCDVNS